MALSYTITPDNAGRFAQPMKEFIMAGKYKAGREATRDKHEERRKLLRHDLEKICGTGDWPARRRETLFKLAWNYGVDEGLEEVVERYIEMKSLFDL